MQAFVFRLIKPCLQLCCSGQQGPACKVALKIKRYLIMLCAMSPRHASSLHLVSNNARSTMAWHCLGGQPAKPTASACSRGCFWLVAFCAVYAANTYVVVHTFAGNICSGIFDQCFTLTSCLQGWSLSVKCMPYQIHRSFVCGT